MASITTAPRVALGRFSKRLAGTGASVAVARAGHTGQRRIREALWNQQRPHRQAGDRVAA
jgi:hypothetical protein